MNHPEWWISPQWKMDMSASKNEEFHRFNPQCVANIHTWNDESWDLNQQIDFGSSFSWSIWLYLPQRLPNDPLVCQRETLSSSLAPHLIGIPAPQLPPKHGLVCNTVNVVDWLVWGAPPLNNFSLLNNRPFFCAPPPSTFFLNWFQCTFNWNQFTFNWFQFTFN